MSLDRTPRERLETGRRRLGRLVFGDRLGLLVFLASLTFVCLYWRVGVFINDNYTIANAVVAVADGHFAVERIVYGPPTGSTPGMHVVDGRLYGRNYGHVVATLPFLWVLEAVAALAELRIALAGAWSVLLLGVSLQIGRLWDREEVFAVAGSVLATGVFLLNVAFARPLADRWVPLLALQTSTMVAAAFSGVIVYRLACRLAGRRVGFVAGLGLVVATPFGFWAAVPKRHVVTGLLAALVLYSVFRARDSGDARFRALAYVWVGLAAWVHAAEALVLLLTLLVIDLPTARTNDARSLAAIAGAFLVSLLPFFVTNLLVAGNPIEPPRLLPNYGGSGGILSSDGLSGGSSGGSGTSGPSTGSPVAVGLVGSVLGTLEQLLSLFTQSARVSIERPARLYHTFVRSGYLPGVASEDGQQAIALSLLESMPVLGGLLAYPIAAARRHLALGALRLDARGATMALAGLQVVGYTLLFASNLPVHATVTVRYLMPVVPALVVLLVGLGPVRRAIQNEVETLSWTYAGTVLVGGQVLLAFVLGTQAGLGEAVQLHALLGLASATVLASWIGHAAWTDDGRPTVGAAVLGVAGGLTTDFLLLSGWVYFAYMGSFALPVVGRLAGALG